MDHKTVRYIEGEERLDKDCLMTVRFAPFAFLFICFRMQCEHSYNW